MHASVNPQDKIEKPSPSNLEKKAYPKSPKTIDGTPARISRLRRTNSPKTLSAKVNSERKIAAPTPIGIETVMHTPRIKAVETRIGPMPPLRPEFCGGSVKNCNDI